MTSGTAMNESLESATVRTRCRAAQSCGQSVTPPSSSRRRRIHQRESPSPPRRGCQHTRPGRQPDARRARGMRRSCLWTGSPSDRSASASAARNRSQEAVTRSCRLRSSTCRRLSTASSIRLSAARRASSRSAFACRNLASSAPRPRRVSTLRRSAASARRRAAHSADNSLAERHAVECSPGYSPFALPPLSKSRA